MKAEVYSWRVATDLKTTLEREARRRKSIAFLGFGIGHARVVTAAGKCRRPGNSCALEPF